MPVLTAQNLHKTFGPQTILDDVSLTIHTEERVGLVGNNGSGKSTLARILAGVELADTGTISLRRDAQVAYLEQEPAFEGNPSVIDVVLSGLKPWSEARRRYETATRAIEQQQGSLEHHMRDQNEAAAELERHGGWNLLHQAEAILSHLGIKNTDALLSTLSGGERRRAALARILVSKPTLAILDEPTNHLDVDAIEWLENYFLEEHQGALLLITHDRYVLDRVVTRTLELAQSKLYSYEGGYHAYLETKAERVEHDARVEANRQNFLRRELAWLQRGPKARTTKQKARIRRAETALKTKAPEIEQRAQLAMDATRSGKTMVSLNHVTLTIGERTLVKDLDLVLMPKERMGIIGRNGSGKTTLLRAILGDIQPTSGSIAQSTQTRIAYFDQGRINLDNQASIFDNVAQSRSHVDIGDRSIDVRTYLEQFLFDVPKQRQKVMSLSGGERARVALAKMMCTGANLVMFDEPTNDLDVSTLSALEEMLLEFAGTAIVVSHDRYFLDRVATSILSFEENGKVFHQPGNYDTYRTLKEQRDAEAKAATANATATKPKPSQRLESQEPTGPKPLTYAERIELEKIVERIEAAEKRVSELETLLSDPNFYSAQQDEVPSTIKSLEQARTEAQRLIERWEELETRREATTKAR